MTFDAGVRLSPLDRARWGVATAIAGAVDAAAVPGILAFARTHAVELVVARCAAADVAAAQAMEDAGFRLMDTLVAYGRATAGASRVAEGDPRMRVATRDDAERVREIARAAFRGYAGHYHADPRLDPAHSDEVYADWAFRSCAEPGVADAVLVVDVEGRPAAFATLALRSAEVGEGVLFGVAPEARGRGVYPALVRAGLAFFAERGRRRMTVSTQVTNLTVQRAWVRLGFEPEGAVHTFHLWSSERGEPAPPRDDGPLSC